MNGLHALSGSIVAAYDRFAPHHRASLLAVRAMIFEVASRDARIGPIEEALRWGEPAYLTPVTKAGSTLRLGVEKSSGVPAVFFNCNTTLVEGFRAQFGTTLRYSKNRAVLIDPQDEGQTGALSLCIAAGLTYHLKD